MSSFRSRYQRFCLGLVLLLSLALVLAACGDNTNTPAPAATTAAATTAAATTAAATTAAATTAAATTAAATTAAATTAAATTAAATTSAATTAATSATTAASTGPTDYSKIGKELADAYAGKYKGTKVSISHGLATNEEVLFKSTFKDFTDKTGITINMTAEGGNSNANWNVKFQSGTIEDIVNFPQPGTMALYAKQGKIVDLNKFMNQDWLKQNYKQGFIDTNTVAGQNGSPMLGGVFERINYKAAVWYPKKAFDAAGYKVPTTWTEMQALMDQIVKDGDTPWCAGIESGGATGWPVTDWIEQIMLRTTSLENYDKWVKGDLQFTSPEVRNAFDTLSKIWFNDKYVYGGRKSITTTNFGDAPTPMLQNPPKCWMYNMGNFITSFFVKNKPGVKAGVDYDFFPLPAIDPKYGAPTEFAGDLFSMTNDRPEVRAVMEYFTTYQAIAPWIKAGQGALSPHNDQVLSDYTNELERKMAQTIMTSPNVRFDGADLMPAEVGSGTFWKGATDWVAGSANLDQALTTIQNGWNNVKK